MPAATDLAPSRAIAWASTVAVVVPSPAAVGGAGRDLADELGAHVLEAVGEVDLLGDGDAVLGDARRAVGLGQHDVAALGAERHLHGIGQQIDPAHHARARVAAEADFLSGHGVTPPIVVLNGWAGKA